MCAYFDNHKQSFLSYYYNKLLVLIRNNIPDHWVPDYLVLSYCYVNDKGEFEIEQNGTCCIKVINPLVSIICLTNHLKGEKLQLQFLVISLLNVLLTTEPF